jgi:hypothetical protein
VTYGNLGLVKICGYTSDAAKSLAMSADAIFQACQVSRRRC